ncbi:MAG: TetR/AcrR family transcriptional regulator [Vicinamibacterales bacterium]
MPRPLRVTPDRILTAAAAEFSERGYAGARVDRIASRAGINKAMLYYHFRGKQALYRALLRATFAPVAERLSAIAESPDAPADRLAAAVASVAAFVQEHAYFPAIMLREIAERGAHMDGETLEALAAVPHAFARIIADGIARGAFRPMHPMSAYFTTLAPILMFVASTPVRAQLVSRGLAPAADRPLLADQFFAELQRSLRAAFAAAPDESEQTP